MRAYWLPNILLRSFLGVPRKLVPLLVVESAAEMDGGRNHLKRALAKPKRKFEKEECHGRL